MRRRFVLPLFALGLAALVSAEPRDGTRQAPLRLAIAGLVHGHVSGFLRAAQARKDVEIVGIFDPDVSLRQNAPAQRPRRRRLLHRSGDDAGR
jgi:hypothetical protein